MGVYACFLISLLLLLIFQTFSNANSSFEYVASNSNQSINSIPLQQHHQVLVTVSPRDGRSGGSGGEENWTASERVVLRAKGGRSGGVGGSNINHRPGKQKNAASNLVNSQVTNLLPILLLTSYFFMF